MGQAEDAYHHNEDAQGDGGRPDGNVQAHATDAIQALEGAFAAVDDGAAGTMVRSIQGRKTALEDILPCALPLYHAVKGKGYARQSRP